MDNNDQMNQSQILIEFSVVEGVRQVALTPADLAKKSGEAIDSVMSTIRQVGLKISETTKKMINSPDEVEITFGVKLNFEGSAIITKASAEGSFEVKMTFKK